MVFRRLKSRGAHIAIRAGVPIVPMALVGTRKILAPNSAHLHPGRAELRVGTPMPTTGAAARAAKQLIADVQQEVARLAGVTWPPAGSSVSDTPAD